MSSRERREMARQQIATIRDELTDASNTQLSEELRSAENTKLFATSIVIMGLVVMGSSIGVRETVNNEITKAAMLGPVATGGAIASVGFLLFSNARLTAEEIFRQAQQRGINVIKGPHRRLDLPKE